MLAVELSSFQLHWTSSLRPLASAVLNVAEDHVDWHGSMDDYAADKGRVYDEHQVACVYNVADPRDRAAGARRRRRGGLPRHRLHPRGPVGRDARASSRTSSSTGRSSPTGDRAAAELGTGRRRPPGRAAQRRQRPRSGGPGPRLRRARRRRSATGCGPSCPTRTGSPAWPSVDGRRPTSTTARRPTRTRPQRRSQAYDSVVWLAGGLAKGASFDDLVERVSGRLRGVVAVRHRRSRRSSAALAATRARRPGGRGRQRRDWSRGCRRDDRGRAGSRRAGASRRHRAARAGLRVHGPVPRLRASAATSSPPSSGRGRWREPDPHPRDAGCSSRAVARPVRLLDRPLTSYLLVLGQRRRPARARAADGAVGEQRDVLRRDRARPSRCSSGS